MSAGPTLKLEEEKQEQRPKLPCCSGPMGHGHHICWTWDPPFCLPAPPIAMSRVGSVSFLPLGFLAPIQVGYRCFWSSLDLMHAQVQGGLGK